MKKPLLILAGLILIGVGIYVGKTKERAPVTVTIPGVYGFNDLYYLKDGSDIYLLQAHTWEGEWLGALTVHVDMKNNTVNDIGSMLLFKQGTKIIISKGYNIDYTENHDNGTFRMFYNDADLSAASQATSIPKKDLKIIAAGGKPSTFVMVRAEYNPVTHKVTPTMTQMEPPKQNLSNGSYELYGKPYPTPDFARLDFGSDGKTLNATRDGMHFVYNDADNTLSITY